MGEKEKADAGPSGLLVLIFTIVLKGVGFGAAYGIHKFLHPTDVVLDKAEFLGDLGFVYLALYVLCSTTNVMFMVTQTFRNLAGFPRPDMDLHKVVSDWRNPNAKATGYAILERDGDAGRFNRATRAVYNYLEYIPILLSLSVVTGYLFPFPVFLLACAQLVGRVMYSIGYSRSLKSRGPGFLISALSLNILEGLTLLSGLLALRLF